MNFHVMTLFPEMVMNGLNTSILGRAASNGLLSFEAINIRDYTLERHGKVDDYPYGGGAGMVMQAEPKMCIRDRPGSMRPWASLRKQVQIRSIKRRSVSCAASWMG